MKTEHLILGGAVIAGIIIFSKKDFASKAITQVAEETGKATGGAVVGFSKGLVNTIAPRNISTGLYNYLYLDKLEDGYNWIKSKGNPDKFWS